MGFIRYLTFRARYLPFVLDVGSTGIFFFETWNRNITIRAVKVLKKDASFFLGFFEDYVYFYPETGSDANCQYRFSLPFTYKL